MSLFSEIGKTFFADEPPFGLRYTVAAGGAYFQNVKRILEFSECGVLLKGRKGCVSIEGKGLSLGKYYAGDLVVYGNISKIERTGDGKA